MTDTRERILDAALEVFAEKGYEAGTIRSIADRAGVREITVFRYFGNKENLLSEIHKRRSVGPMSKVLLDQAHDRPVGEVLRELGRRYYSQMLSRGNLIRLLVVESESNPHLLGNVSSVPQIVHGELTRYLESKMNEGHIHRCDPSALAQIFMSPFFSMLIGRGMLPKPEMSDDEMADLCVDIFLRGALIERD